MLRIISILTLSLLATNLTWAGEPKPSSTKAPEASVTTTETDSQQFARAKLMEMAKFLGSREKFTVNLNLGYDVLQKSGQKIEFGENRVVALQRPNLLRVGETDSNGAGNLMLLDGKNINMFDSKSGVYAQSPQPGDIDASVIYFVRDLKMRLPLAPMLMAKFADEMQRRVQTVDYVEMTKINGKSVHHIAARNANVDFQVWIVDGKQPLPLRIVMTYRVEEGQPQFWANFTNWNLSPRLDKARFKFSPPPSAKKIAFAAEIQNQTSIAKGQGGRP